ncbi:J domain-containing protein [Spirosoma linguale]|uniref:Heat shock protein DnaJ domain protein n=1 Tax=Spirosoma linguale (strain ATCC 33905 / DSM 74 / LMG 10896 / Claus 1) TaxID=504472 RepID=D2QJR6_SPILD|nr:heat shock protein DnaJ domain protein [Spirosoma linguale DSM 74]
MNPLSGLTNSPTSHLQIRLLVADIADLEAERARIQSLIDSYYRRLHHQLGDLMSEIAQLQLQLATRRASQTRRRSDAEAAHSARVRFEQTQHTVQEALANMPTEPDTAVDETELRKLYRQAVAQAHPDLFFNEPDKQKQATAFMAELNEAYERKDLTVVRKLAQQLQDGLLFLDETSLHNDPEALQQLVERLTQRKQALEADIQTLRRQEGYNIMSQSPPEQAVHFDQLQKNLQEHLAILAQSLDTL